MTTVREVAVKLRAVGRDAGPGARAAATAMGYAYQRAVVTEELSRYTHPRRTPTPSPAGEPPARVSGQLARSVQKEPTITAGSVSSTEVGPRAEYGRIQELGGASGRDHKTTLPPRPYLAPALRRMEEDGELHRVAVEAFRAATNT